MDKNQLKHIIKEEYQNVKSFMEDKYGFTPELGKVISNPYAKSFVNEVSEPEVISQLRDIVNKKQNKKIKDPKSGKMMRVDLMSASAVIAVYDALRKPNVKANFASQPLPKMVSVAFKVAKVRKENVAKNHDGKAAPYGSGYKKVNELLVIVDKFDKNKQDYGKIYYRDGGNRPGDGDIKKANKELEKLSKKHKGLTLVSIGRNSKMYDVNESVNEADITIGGKEYNLKKSGNKITLINKKLSADKFIFRNTKEFKDWADDQVEPIGGTQSSHFGVNEAKYKHTYKSITDQQKDLKRIFPSGHPRVSVKAYHDMNPQGKMKTSYVEIEGPSSYVDAYKKMAFNGKGTMRDVIKFVEKNESINERVRFSVVAKYGGFEMVEKSNQSAFIISKSGKTVGQLKRTSKYLKDDIKRFIKMVKDGKIKDVKSYKTIESVNEAKSMDMKKRLKVYDKLKKGDKITIKYGSSMRSGREQEFVVSKGKTLVGKQKVERIILKNPANPKGVKYYLYQRNGNVTMAIGDMAATIEDMHESVNEGKKRFRQQDGIGKSKYTISYHDGKQKHKDGSDFFGIKIFKNKKDLESFRKDLKKQGYIEESVNEGVFSNLDLIRQNSKDARDFIKNVFKDDDFKDMKNDKEFLKYLKSIYEGFSSDAQRKAAFASGYKAKGKKGKKKESIEEYDVENYQDIKEFAEFMKEYKSDVNEAEYQGRDVKLGKIMQGDVKKFKVYVKNPKGNVVKVNFGHKGKGGEKTMRIKKSDPARRKAFRSRHNCDNPGPRHKARYWACRTW